MREEITSANELIRELIIMAKEEKAEFFISVVGEDNFNKNKEKYLDSSIYFNEVAEKAGVNSAVMFGALLRCDELCTGEFFPKTRDEIKKLSGLSASQQRDALSKLVEEGLVESKRIGIPPVTYYRLNYDALVSVLEQWAEKHNETQY